LTENRSQKLCVSNILLVLAEFRKSLAKVATVTEFFPVLVGDGVRELYRRIEVPVARRELGPFLQIHRLHVDRSESAEFLPQLLVAILQSLRRLLL